MAQDDEEGKNAEYRRAAQPLMQVSFSQAFGDAKMLASLGRKVCRGKPSTAGCTIGDMTAGISMLFAKLMGQSIFMVYGSSVSGK